MSVKREGFRDGASPGATTTTKDRIADKFTDLAATTTDLLGADTRTEEIRAQKTAYDLNQTNLSGLILGIVIAGIMGVAVAIPVLNDVIASANLTGTTKTVVGLIPLFIGLLVLVAVASPLMNRM
ncbi:hypothetical protein [Halobaculum sp. D14]|uniref:hypothetical protein n=1 Tax=Halobaculum sp. D14 TaxID=3421642 RepID=UPI003EC0E308